MRYLVVGNGGREHALLWKLRQDAPEAELFITRGNGGTTGLAKSLPIDPTEAASLAAWAIAHDIQLTIIGPEAPLAEGIVDHFEREGLCVFGPSRAAAAIESSKAFAKSVMKHARVPTAAFATFTNAGEAEAYIRKQRAPLVVKASGLAAGKGAVVCQTIEEAVSAARAMLLTGSMGQAGREIVVEEFLAGEELSVLALTDGENVLLLTPAQDHKRLHEGDTGPNTGGMGAYAPVSLATPALLERVQREILSPTLAALRQQNRRFRGVLYAGLMLTREGPKVVEFNARFGDPETQAILPLLGSSLIEPMSAIARGESIANLKLTRKPGAAVTTVLAAAGYPDKPEKGKLIRIPAELESASDVLIFHAGTARVEGKLVSTGGRVLAVTAVADTFARAAERSRAAAEAIEFDGKQYRRDVGWRELQRTTMAAQPV
jgi:phosphoribosylamine---glycine ligase